MGAISAHSPQDDFVKQEERHRQILELLRLNGYQSVDSLSQKLNVSEMTIRRDLAELQQLELVARHFGGASMAPERGELEWPYPLRAQEQMAAKQQIGKVAAAYIQEGDVVILDGGTTVLQVAQQLLLRYQQNHQQHHPQKQQPNHLTIVTNSLPNLRLLAAQRHLHLIATGGDLHWENQVFLGPLAVDTLRKINANLTILATTGFSLSKGLTNRNIHEAEVKRAMIEASDKVILVMDSSKMNKHTLATVGPVEAIHTLITDDGLADDDRKAIAARGVEVVIANTVV